MPFFMLVEISDENLLLIIGILALMFYAIYHAFAKIKKDYDFKANELNFELKKFQTSNDAILAQTKADLQAYWQKWGFEELQKYKTVELEKEKAVILTNTTLAATNNLEKWKVDYTQIIRNQAARQSRAVSLGKAVEHLLPFSHKFPFNYKDARFMGSPIDFLVFDGMEDEEDLITIYFVEVKTGTSKISSRQTKIKEAVESKRILWLPINPDKL